MGRTALLIPYKDAKSGSWVLSIPPSLSPSGKRKREFFSIKKEAEKRADQIKNAWEAGHRIARVAGPELIRCAVDYDESFRSLYGFEGGLREACEAFMAHLDQTRESLLFRDLLDAYEQAKFNSWSVSYQRNWKWFRGLLSEIQEQPIVAMNSDFWAGWLEQTARKSQWKDCTANDVAAMISSVWSAACKKGQVERNPLSGVHRRKVRRTSKAIYTVDEVRCLMNAAWEHDKDLVPYFGIAIFAGLRPDENSEIANLTWEDVNFDEGWIRVAANFDNKTGTKRFVPIEPNLQLWLEPWRGGQGSVVPKNLRSRRRWLTRGKYQSPRGTPPSQWKELVPFGSEVRDITRHTYGSYLEGKYRDRHKVMSNMGHMSLATYEQHYRNARSPQEAEAFWSIVPPTGNEESPEGA